MPNFPRFPQLQPMSPLQVHRTVCGWGKVKATITGRGGRVRFKTANAALVLFPNPKRAAARSRAVWLSGRAFQVR